jgi:hypothetical protein
MNHDGVIAKFPFIMGFWMESLHCKLLEANK